MTNELWEQKLKFKIKLKLEKKFCFAEKFALKS